MASFLVGGGGAFTLVAAWVTQFTTDEVSLGEGAFTAVLLVGLAIYSIGLVWLGIWLRADEVVMESTGDTTD
jgi:biotin transporter BioY